MANSKVQRYGLDCHDCEGGGSNCGAFIEERPTGDYVLHADYVNLETELRDTKRALRAEIAKTMVPARLFEPDFNDAEYELCLDKAVLERLGKR